MERLYTIPLRREFSKAANYKRTAKSIKAVRQFIQKHMKCENVKIGKELNLELWKHGRQNPPAKIKVKVLKDKYKGEDIVLINLPTVKIELPKEKKKKVKKKEEEPAVKEDEKQKEQDKEKKEVIEKGIEKEMPKTFKEKKPMKQETTKQTAPKKGK